MKAHGVVAALVTVAGVGAVTLAFGCGTLSLAGAGPAIAAVLPAQAPPAIQRVQTGPGATFGPATATKSQFVNWPTYQFDRARDGFNPNTTPITPASIAGLHLAWQISSNGSAGQPIVVTNVAGHTAIVITEPFSAVSAFDALTGASVWSTSLPTQSLANCGYYAGPGGTAQFDEVRGTLFVTAGNGLNPNHVVLYALNVTTGAVVGSVDVTPTLLSGETTSSHTGVLLVNGIVYVGTGSNCEGAKPAHSWLGRLVAVNAATLKIVGTFFTTYGQGGSFGGGGIWSWGAASADPSGNIYVGTGNAETLNAEGGATPPPPVVATTDEEAGYAEHLVKLRPSQLSVEDSNYPGFNFAIGELDLDYAGTPVIFAPPLGAGCPDLLSATQGKGGTLVINDTLHLTPPIASFALSIPSPAALYIGNPGYSPSTGYLYAPITSAGNGSSLLPPGLAAIGNCGLSLVWHTSFGPDSAAYTTQANPRSAPTVTAGGVVFLATPCTTNGTGACTTPGASNGALWALDASTGTLLGNANGAGKPVLTTTYDIRMAPSADGQWLWLTDTNGNLYGLTVDPKVPAIRQRPGRSHPPAFWYRGT